MQGDVVEFVLFGVAFGAALSGCASSNEYLKRRAAYDMRCPEEQLHVDELDERTRGVRGCGQQLTYVEMCQAASSTPFSTGLPPDQDCTWVLNSSVGGHGPHPAPMWTPAPPMLTPQPAGPPPAPPRPVP